MTARAGWTAQMDASRALSIVLGAVATGLVFLGFGLAPNPPYYDPFFLALFAGSYAVMAVFDHRKRGILRAIARGLAIGGATVALVLAMGAIHDALRPTVERDPGLSDLWGVIVIVGSVIGGVAAVLWERTARRDVALGLLLYGLLLGGFILALGGRSYALLGVFLAGVGGVWAFILHERKRLAQEKARSARERQNRRSVKP